MSADPSGQRPSKYKITAKFQGAESRIVTLKNGLKVGSESSGHQIDASSIGHQTDAGWSSSHQVAPGSSNYQTDADSCKITVDLCESKSTVTAYLTEIEDSQLQTEIDALHDRAGEAQCDLHILVEGNLELPVQDSGISPDEISQVQPVDHIARQSEINRLTESSELIEETESNDTLVSTC